MARRWRRSGRGPAVGSPRVIVVGAGFAGLATVSKLTRAGLDVTLIDRNIYSTFQPLLYQVATGGLNPSDVAYPLRGFARKYGARFRHGEVSGIDSAASRITLTDGSELPYDYLIIGTGVAAAYHGVTGAAASTFGLYTRRDAVALCDQIMARLERLSAPGNSQQLGITVVGGGATGIELAGTLAELRNIALASSYPDVDPARIQITLVEQAPALLGPFPPSLRSYAHRQLQDRGVDVRLDTTIREITPDRVLLTDGQELRSELTVWAAGVAVAESVGRWDLPQGRGGRIRTGADLRVNGCERIFAIGDIALIDDQPLPQLAQPALQTGRHAAAQIRRLESGQDTVPFRYHDKGTMATIGRRSAVVALPAHIRIRGTLAWLAWLVLHLVTLLGHRNRISALVNLSYRYLAWSRSGGLMVGDEPARSQSAGSQPARSQPAPGHSAGSRSTG
jgi:NADH dehydrogenase